MCGRRRYGAAVKTIALLGLLAACNPKPTMKAGGATALAGMLLAALPDERCDRPYCVTNGDVGGVIVLAGVAMVLVGAVGHGLQQHEEAERRKRPVLLIPTPPPPFPTPSGPPGQCPPAPNRSC